MKLKLLTALAALVACSGAWASDVTYKCVVEHSLGIDMSEMRAVRFRADYEYRLEPVASYLEKTNGGWPSIFNMKEGKAYTYAVRRTNEDPSNYRSWAVLEDAGTFIKNYHYGEGLSRNYKFYADEGRLVAHAYNVDDWVFGDDDDDSADVYTDFTTCTAHYD